MEASPSFSLTTDRYSFFWALVMKQKCHFYVIDHPPPSHQEKSKYKFEKIHFTEKSVLYTFSDQKFIATVRAVAFNQ